MENKYCLTCLEEGKIRICPDECDDQEHRDRYSNKVNYSSTLNDLVDQRVNEVMDLIGFLSKVYDEDKKKQ